MADNVLHNFAGGPDASEPYSNLVADKVGNLYGTSPYGGAFGYGAVFVLCAPGTAAPAPCLAGHAPWQEFVLYSFKGIGNKDAANPYGAVIFAQNPADGAWTLFGTTFYGGNAAVCALQGCGTVFQLCAPKAQGGCAPGAVWTETILYQFAGGADGANPWAGVIGDNADNLYGTTVFGGNNGPCHGDGVAGCGTVYELCAPKAQGGCAPGVVRVERIMHKFGVGADGQEPYGALCCNSNAPIATFYGTTYGGGANGDGTIFKITNAGIFPEALLYNFCSVAGCTDGANPFDSVTFDAAGDIYTTTYFGGAFNDGTIFELPVPPALPVTLHSFAGGPGDGANPTAGLTLNAGFLYGTTLQGGINGGIAANCLAAGCGTVFDYKLPGGPEAVVWNFTGTPGDGANPWGGVIFDPTVRGGFLYGTTESGGNLAGDGVAYQQIP